MEAPDCSQPRTLSDRHTNGPAQEREQDQVGFGVAGGRALHEWSGSGSSALSAAMLLLLLLLQTLGDAGRVG